MTRISLADFLQVDVIVNTTSSNLNLSGNASSKALSAAAGPKLQEECKKIGQVKTGEIVVTNGANLACKHVFHTSCPGWEKGQGEKVSTDIIFFSCSGNFDVCLFLFPYPPTLTEEAHDHATKNSNIEHGSSPIILKKEAKINIVERRNNRNCVTERLRILS